jgi:4-hydroxymandelate oxidase
VGCLNAQPKLFESLKLPNFGMFTTLNASQVLREVASSFVAPEVTWKDVEWLASLSTLPIILKGVLNPEDVVFAAQHGAKGIIVSNHGGRQMDRVISTRDALRLINEEVRKKNVKVELMVDGGLRDAHDITVALELGAKAVMLGRPILHALGSSSEEDALYKYIQVLSSDLQRRLALMGRRKLPQEEQQVGDQQRIFFT